MKITLPIKLVCVLVLLISSAISAQTFTVDDLDYTVTTGTNVSVGKGNNPCPTGALTIPSTVTYASVVYTVTSTGSSAFAYCSGLTSISIPTTVTSIGIASFAYCSGLTSINIPNSVTSIGSSTFRDCTSLTSFSIPNSVTSIGSSAFAYCSGLTSISIPNSVTSIDIGAFRNCIGLLSVSISNSVTSIGAAVFSYCSSLTSITIPNSVTSIGNSILFSCTGLTDVNVSWAVPLPLDVTSLVFYGVVVSTVTLNVSAPGVVSDYQAATVWQDFNFGPLSTKTHLLDSNVKIYPNPSKEFIAFSGLSNTENYSIYSVLGTKISKGSVSNNEKIDTQNLTNGAYILKLDNGNSFKFLKK